MNSWQTATPTDRQTEKNEDKQLSRWRDSRHKNRKTLHTGGHTDRWKDRHIKKEGRPAQIQLERQEKE